MTAIRPFRLFISMSSLASARAIVLASVVALLIVPVGCSGGGSTDSAPAAQNTAPAEQPVQAPAAPQPRLRSALKKKENEEAQASAEAKAPAPTKSTTQAKPSGKPADKPVDQWTIDEMKSALAGKDIRYVSAVMAQGTGSQGDSQKGGELSQLLLAVAAMPADAPGPAQLTGGGATRKRSSKRGDDEDEPAITMPTPTAAPGTPAAAAAAPTNTPPPAATPTVPPGQFKIRFGSRDDKD